MGGARGPWRVFFAVIASVFVVWLLSEHVLATSGSMSSRSSTTTVSSAIENFRRSNANRREGPASHPDLDFNYMSKRRVPNGPDPIHNRRAGQSGHPPGLA